MSTCEDVEVLDWSFNYVAILDATKSFVTNVKNNSVAGRTSSFTVQGVDTNGYYYQTYVAPSHYPPPHHTSIAQCYDMMFSDFDFRGSSLECH